MRGLYSHIEFFLPWYMSSCNTSDQAIGSEHLDLYLDLYRPQRSWGKVMFLHVAVILFTGGGCPIACWDTPPKTRGRHPPDQRQAPQEQTSPWDQAPPMSRHPPGPGTPPAQCMLGDTGNKRAVRILLECNLVKNKIPPPRETIWDVQ